MWLLRAVTLPPHNESQTASPLYTGYNRLYSIVVPYQEARESHLNDQYHCAVAAEWKDLTVTQFVVSGRHSAPAFL